MILNIQPIHIEGLTCYEDVLLSTAAYYNKEYQMAFSEIFNFEYNSENSGQSKLLSERLSSGNANIQNLLKQYCGIEVIIKNTETAEDVIRIVKEQLELGYPTIFYVNTFWCPWHRDYQKYCNGHICLAIGIDGRDSIICIDPIEGENHFCLPFEDFKNGSDKCSIVNIQKSADEIEYISILQNSVEKIVDSNVFANMESFAYDFDSQFNFEEEFQNAKIHIWEVLLYRKLIFISGSRYLYSLFINQVNKNIHSQKLAQVEKDLLCVQSKWKIALSLFVKEAYMGYSENINKSISKWFWKILEDERKIILNLKNIVYSSELLSGNSECVQNSDSESEIEYSEYSYIDLRKYYNNTAFHSTCSKECSADFTGTGHYFLSQNAPGEQIITSEKMSFKFPRIQDDNYDNISCNSQIVAIPSGVYKGIMLLGSCEWGNFIDYMKLDFINSETKSIQINFSDWQEQQPRYDEKIIWSGQIYDKQYSMTYNNKHNIYGLFRPIQNTQAIENLILPACSNMHIFAVTLCK